MTEHSSILTFAAFRLLFFAIWSSPLIGQAAPAADGTACGCMFASVAGNTSVKLRGTTNSVRATPHMVVHFGDLLLVGGADTSLVCDGGNDTVVLTQGPHAVPCSVGGGKPILIGGRAQNARLLDDSTLGAGGAADFPLLLAPRATRILDSHPTLRWQCIPNVTVYNLNVRGAGLSWAATATSTAMLKYPNDAPELKRSQPYKLVITAGGRSSEEEDQPGLGFTLLSSEDERRVNAAEAEIDGMTVGTPTKLILKAHLLANNGLIAEAIDLLQEPPHSCDVSVAPDSATTDPDTLQLLGTLYARIGLTRRAEEYLLAALQSSVTSGDKLGEAVSSDYLGQIYVALGNKTNALTKLQQAERAYEAIGDHDKITDVQHRIHALQGP
jgi:hypothetical protein